MSSQPFPSQPFPLQPHPSPLSPTPNQLFLAPTGSRARALAFEFLLQNASFDPLDPPLVLASAASAPAWRALFRDKSVLVPRLASPEEFFARSHGVSARQKSVSGRDRLWILGQVARKNASLLQHLDRAALSREWVMGFAQLFSQMRRACISEFPETPWREDLERLWHAYNARLQALSVFDFEDAPALFAHSGPKNAAFLWPKVVILDDQTALSPALQIGLQTLFDRAELVVGTLCAPGNDRENPVLREALQFWKNRRAKITPSRAVLAPNDRAAARILGAQNGQSAPTHLHLSAAHTPFEELSAIASYIRGEVENGARLENFTLVLPSTARVLGPLQAAFAAHGVPLFLPFERPLNQSPLVRRLLRLFGSCGQEWNADVLHDLFGDGTIALPGFDAGRLRRAAIAARFGDLKSPAQTRDRWEKRLELLRETRQDDRAKREAIAASLEADDLGWVEQIQAACQSCAGDAKSPQKIGGAAWLQSLDALTSLLCAHLDEGETAFAERARAQLAALQNAARCVVERARSFELDGDDGARKPGEWLEWLQLECETGEETRVRGGVRVSTSPHTLDWSGTVFFAGLCEGVFPAPEVSGPFAVRGAELFEPLQSGAPPLARATHVLARAVAESKTLFLSYPRTESGGETAPSPLLDDLRALWEKHTFPTLPPVAPTSRERFLREVSPRHPDLPDSLAILRELHTERAAPEKIGVYDGALGPAGARLMALWSAQKPAFRWSASALESYARCPLRFFFERVLELKSLEAGDDDLDAATTGSLLHEILFAFHQSQKTQLSAQNENEALDRLRDCAWRACQTLPLRPILREAEFHRLMGLNGIGGPLWKTLRAEISARETSDSGPWSAPTTPLLHSPWRAQLPEIQLGLEQQFTLQMGDVTLGGVMDRLDISEDGAIVVILDYKSGGVANLPSLCDGDSGLHFQLGLYALKARDYFASWPQPPRLAMGFLSLKTGEFRGAIGQSETLGRNGKKFVQKKALELDETQWENWLALLETRILQVGAHLRNGDFNLSLRDEKKAKCEHCSWKVVCARDSQTQDVRVTFFEGKTEFYLPEVWRPA